MSSSVSGHGRQGDHKTRAFLPLSGGALPREVRPVDTVARGLAEEES